MSDLDPNQIRTIPKAVKDYLIGAHKKGEELDNVELMRLLVVICECLEYVTAKATGIKKPDVVKATAGAYGDLSTKQKREIIEKLRKDDPDAADKMEALLNEEEGGSEW